MFWIIWMIIILAWIVALASGYTMQGYIHILVVVAVILLAIRLIQGKKRKKLGDVAEERDYGSRGSCWHRGFNVVLKRGARR